MPGDERMREELPNAAPPVDLTGRRTMIRAAIGAVPIVLTLSAGTARAQGSMTSGASAGPPPPEGSGPPGELSDEELLRRLQDPNYDPAKDPALQGPSPSDDPNYDPASEPATEASSLEAPPEPPPAPIRPISPSEKLPGSEDFEGLDFGGGAN